MLFKSIASISMLNNKTNIKNNENIENNNQCDNKVSKWNPRYTFTKFNLFSQTAVV
ncbi:hypothetical protein DICPUDRAFT_151293 [Dictyostelium purpureum]|uniref:Uncharacterized protein n=1 Tax=Dictyostelium purpureum TaxID=5786 RepID=F0ZIH3_DICPU|nr:uncharacterized protein DICPUDRAFT_151293 [Dictyostelium purpureum]EGC36262.1 hypothetical protein DICPUDRAFT_151293 [Dictyostelium purpureum]|eukprot:XP_003287208.1 hypothetical protein DICPUDRAFT_151293 [Dictyostelium purpureum]